VSLILGDNSNQNLLQLLPSRNRLGGEVRDAAVGNLDSLLALVNEYLSGRSGVLRV